MSVPEFLNLQIKDSRNHGGGNNVIECRVFKDGTVANLKAEIMCHAKDNPEPERQRLIFGGKELSEESKRLTEYGVKDKGVLHLVVRPSGVRQPTVIPQPTVTAVSGGGGGPIFSQQPYYDNQQFAHVQQVVAPNAVRRAQRQYGQQGGVGMGNYIIDIPQAMNQVARQRIQPDDEELCYETLQDARWVRIYAFIDSIMWLFVLLGCVGECHTGVLRITFWLTLSILIMTFCGYFGAKHLLRPYVGVYVVCLIIELFLEFEQLGYQQSGLGHFIQIMWIFIMLFVWWRGVRLVYVLSADGPNGQPILTKNDRDLIILVNSYGYC